MTETSSPAKPDPRAFSFVVEVQGKRLDKVLRDRIPNLSRTQGHRLIETEQVTVDGQPRKPAYRVEPGEEVTVILPAPDMEPSVHPEPIPLEILYEDDHLLAVNKPAGLVVHPGPGHPGGTLVNALLFHYPPIENVGPPGRAGIVHRLDKETSGVMIVAKSQAVLEALQRQFRNREVEKTYLALVTGRVEPPEGIIEVPLGRDPTDRQKIAPSPEGKYSRTRYRVAGSFREHTLLEVHPYTGRTHQVRVHLSWLGHPVVGDTQYGQHRQSLLKDRHFLHASRLALIHPRTKQETVFQAPTPEELNEVLRRLQSAVPRERASGFANQDRQED